MKKIFALLLIFFLALELKAQALPVSFDLRDYGLVTPIKNQGIPGPCWAFAALSAMESNYLSQNLNADKEIPDLSELQLAYYCYKGSTREKRFTSGRKSGLLSLEGNLFMPVAFMSRLAGPTDEKSLPYMTDLSNSQKISLSKKKPEKYKRSMILKEAFFLSGTQTLGLELKKDLIMRHGAIAVSIYSEPEKFHTRGNFYTYFNNSHGNGINHFVTLIGWDDKFPAKNFSPVPSRSGAWLAKNSWGESRGSNGGYFWMSYDQHTYGGTAFIVAKNDRHIKHYGYDDLGWCNNLNYSWAANVFKIEGKHEKLREISFYTPDINTPYEIFIYRCGKNFPMLPTSGELVKNLKGEIYLTGYHTIKLPEDIWLESGEYISIVLRLGVNAMPVEMKIKNYSDNFAVNEGESFFSAEGERWIDGVNLKANACIKIFTY